MAAGVILNLIISTNPFLAIILQQAIAFSRSSYLAGINVAVAYRMVINLLPLGEGWDGATICFFYRQRRLFDFAPCQPATRRERRRVVADIREHALGNNSHRTLTHRAKP